VRGRRSTGAFILLEMPTNNMKVRLRCKCVNMVCVSLDICLNLSSFFYFFNRLLSDIMLG
jgi:hypothetical protein